MDLNERYLASSNVWKRYGILFNVLIKNYGFDKALEHHLEGRLEVSEKAMKALKEKHDTMDEEAYTKILRDNFLRAGYDTQVEATDKFIKVTVERCPFYNGLLQAGIKHEIILSICKNSYAQRARNYPSLFMGLMEQRESLGGRCVEGFKL